MELAKLTFPTIHLNGTSAEQPTEDYVNSVQAVDAAIAAVHKMEFHSRDYYVVPGSFPIARAEHIARLEKLQSVRDELMAIAEHCAQFRKEDRS